MIPRKYSFWGNEYSNVEFKSLILWLCQGRSKVHGYYIDRDLTFFSWFSQWVVVSAIPCDFRCWSRVSQYLQYVVALRFAVSTKARVRDLTAVSWGISPESWCTSSVDLCTSANRIDTSYGAGIFQGKGEKRTRPQEGANGSELE